jgi:FKBP12-rapamycin complex-associated protein
VEDIPLINGLELALHSPQIPSSIMNALLNLAEFMEMQDKPLPLDVQLLAKRAESRNMFAKCLRYREQEFNSLNILPSGECIEALISVNNELGSPERATGVLHYVNQHYSHISIEPQWLQKLCHWEDARQSYLQENLKWTESYPDDRPPKHPSWMAGELGNLHCLLALGEFVELEESALVLKNHLKAAEQPEEHSSWMAEVQKLGANAAWMLGNWQSLEAFLEGDLSQESHDVELNNNASFYRAVLAIHKENYSLAMLLIHETREKMSDAISSLLSESYSRAYRAMVSMQILSEMEEVVELKQSTTKPAIEVRVRVRVRVNMNCTL